jgi:hypothetical protein
METSRRWNVREPMMNQNEKSETAAPEAGPSARIIQLPGQPYAMPDVLEAELGEILAYWEGLKRHDNNIPFWDDVQLTALREYSDMLMMIDVFEKPERFRFGVIGRAIIERYGREIESHFVDEVARKAPFEYLLSQASATLQAGKPTFYHHVAMNAHAPDPSKSYLRLLLPLWGEGHIAMLMGAVVFAA